MITAKQALAMTAERPEYVAWEVHKMGGRVEAAANQGERSVKMGYLFIPQVVKAFRARGYTLTETATNGAEVTLIEW